MKKGIIIGGGIGGLSTGIALKQKGISFTIYERAPEIRDIGAGIWVAPNALKVYQALGISDEIIENGMELDGINLANTSGRIINHVDGQEVKKTHGFGTVSIHRAVLQKILSSHIPADQLVLGKTCVSFSQSADQATVHFSDGSSASGDFLIFADGIHSIGREVISPTPKRYSGQTCWRFITKYIPDINSTQMFEIWSSKKGVRLGYSQIDKEHTYCFITKYEPAEGKDPENIREFLLDLCDDFQPNIKELIRSVEPGAIIRNDIFDFKPITKWADGRVVLMGDAAHATTPNLGQGACQAIEDALVLADELDRTDPEQAFINFFRRRKEKTTYITNTSWKFGQLVNASSLKKKLIQWLMGMIPESVNKKQMDKVYHLQ